MLSIGDTAEHRLAGQLSFDGQAGNAIVHRHVISSTNKHEG
jgi:hypothetical protein